MFDERALKLFQSLGLKPEDLPEPKPPTEQQIVESVRALLDPDKARTAAELLCDWPDLSLHTLCSMLSDGALVAQMAETKELNGPLMSIIDLLCKHQPQFIANHIGLLIPLAGDVASKCVEAAFQTNPYGLVSVLEDFLARTQNELVVAALCGIRKARRSNRLSVHRDDRLYQICLRLCAPAYALDKSWLQTDPAVFVCQCFSEFAEVDLAARPYFDIDNPHLEEILYWLPSVVSHADSDLVYSEFKRAVADHHAEKRSTHTGANRLIPLAALKLGQACRGDIDRLLSKEKLLPVDMRAAAIKALAIVICSRDPLSDAQKANRDGRYESLNIWEQTILLVYNFDGQVSNGHVFQFLSNTNDLMIDKTLESLERFGDSIGARLLREGSRLVLAHSGLDTVHGLVRKLNSSQRESIEKELSELFQKYCSQENIAERVYRFVLDHSGHFKR